MATKFMDFYVQVKVLNTDSIDLTTVGIRPIIGYIQKTQQLNGCIQQRKQLNKRFALIGLYF